MKFYCFTIFLSNLTYTYAKIANNYTEKLVHNLMKNSCNRAKILALPITEHMRLAVLDTRLGFTRDDTNNNDKVSQTQ